MFSSLPASRFLFAAFLSPVFLRAIQFSLDRRPNDK
jgi:hypothetical protein